MNEWSEYIICPYCGHNEGYATDYVWADDIIIECTKCDQGFYLSLELKAKAKTAKIEEENE